MKTDTLEDFKIRVVAYNFYENKNAWSANELKKPYAKQHYEKWKKIQNNLEKIVEKDLLAIDSFKEYVMVDKQKFLPKILEDVFGENIHAQTFMCVDKALGLTAKFYSKYYQNNNIYKSNIYLVQQACPFLKEPKTIKKIIRKKINGF